MASLPLGTRIAVFVRDRGACVFCGATYQNGAQLSVDHVQSRKRGGSNMLTNLVTACLPCNKDKAHFSLKAYLVELEDRGQILAGEDAKIVARVNAACMAKIDWAAVKRAAAELKRQAEETEDDDD